jgi:hypothetical protein
VRAWRKAPSLALLRARGSSLTLFCHDSGMNAATEWRDILKETCKSVVILIILERIFLTRHDTWLEVRKTQQRLLLFC